MYHTPIGLRVLMHWVLFLFFLPNEEEVRTMRVIQFLGVIPAAGFAAGGTFDRFGNGLQVEGLGCASLFQISFRGIYQYAIKLLM